MLFEVMLLVGLTSPLTAIGVLGARLRFQAMARAYPEGSAGRDDSLRIARFFLGMAKWCAILTVPVSLVGFIGVVSTN